MSLVDAIKPALLDKGMTQRDLARALDMTDDQLSKSLRGVRRFSAEEAEKVREVLNLRSGSYGGTIADSEDELSARTDFAARLRNRRTDLGWSLERLARGALETDRLQQLEAGEVSPFLFELDELSARLRAPLDWLVSGVGPGPEPIAKSSETDDISTKDRDI